MLCHIKVERYRSRERQEIRRNTQAKTPSKNARSYKKTWTEQLRYRAGEKSIKQTRNLNHNCRFLSCTGMAAVDADGTVAS